MTDTISVAVAEYVARRDRRANPPGSFDKGGRFYPADSEYLTCCNAIRTPSRAYPYSLMTHCRTATHIARLYGVDASAVRRAAKAVQ